MFTNRTNFFHFVRFVVMVIRFFVVTWPKRAIFAKSVLCSLCRCRVATLKHFLNTLFVWQSHRDVGWWFWAFAASSLPRSVTSIALPLSSFPVSASSLCDKCLPRHFPETTKCRCVTLRYAASLRRSVVGSSGKLGLGGRVKPRPLSIPMIYPPSSYTIFFPNRFITHRVIVTSQQLDN